ncbi:MAG: polysaccharide deacetylase family protein [Psychroserpens sp.]|uniref:polysaccharide deacetylase family protein n=1 Tax=Psychroserpens sp. TaxID=2020870 RepID=UPI0030036D86
MKIAPVKTPAVAKKMFPNYVWDIATTKKELFLTFDDGPTPDITNWTIETLKQYNAKATFFCIGANIEKHPAIFKNIINDGHTIGNHTQHHVKGWKTKTKNYLKEVAKTQDIINAHITPGKSKIFRPPYGQIKPKQGKKLIDLGYQIIMWDVLSFDWDQDLSEEKCLENVISKSKAGSIIVFHDSVKAAKNMMYVLPKVLETFSKKGYEFKSLS